LKPTKSLHYHIWKYFFIFVLIVLFLLWFFQIIFLGTFYESLKKENIIKISEEMLSDYYKVMNKVDSDDTFLNKYDSSSHRNEFDYLIRDYKNEIYLPTNEFNKNPSILLDSFKFDTYRLKLHLSTENSIIFTDFSPQLNSKILTIGSKIYSDNEIVGYMFISTMISPITPTINILKQQLIYITIILICIGLLVSFFMSKSIVKPICTITKSADKLASGSYRVKFDGGKFDETQKLASTLNYASTEISKVDELQRDLIANVSHDLRTPLTMLKAYAEMIRDLSGDNPKKRLGHLNIIIDETDRLALLVNDMLDLSKLENGSVPLNISEFYITDILKDIIDKYKGLSKSMGYNIHFSADENVLVKCDLGKIEQVIFNLINNAINYTGDDKQVYVKQINDEDFVTISITDTGRGISEENLHLIFDKYYRGEKTKREVMGTGLGLSIVKAILQKHNFPFGVQSKIDNGSTFWFKIKIFKNEIL